MDIQFVSSFSTTDSVLEKKEKQKSSQKLQAGGMKKMTCSLGDKQASPSEHEFWIFGHILLHQVVQQRFQDIREVLQFTVQRHRQQRGHIGPVSGGKRPLDL